MIRINVRIRLLTLKVLFSFLDQLSDMKSINRYVIKKKIYVGATIIYLSLINASCKSDNDPTVTNKNVSSRDTLQKEFVSSLNQDNKIADVQNATTNEIKNSNNINSNTVHKLVIDNIIDTDTLILATCYDISIVEPGIEDNIETDIFDYCDQMPQFPGGSDSLTAFLKRNITFPKDAVEDGISGRVFVRFTVTNQGDITNINIIRSLFPSCDAEVIRIIEMMPKWIPGKQNNENVNVWFALPVDFKLLY